MATLKADIALDLGQFIKALQTAVRSAADAAVSMTKSFQGIGVKYDPAALKSLRAEAQVTATQIEADFEKVKYVPTDAGDQFRNIPPKAEDAGKKAGSKFSEGFKERLKGIGDVFVGSIAAQGFMAIANAGRQAVNEYIELDKQIKNIGTLGVENFEGFKDKVVEVSLGLTDTAAVVADGVYQAISAGIKGTQEEIIGFVEVASKAAVAGLTDTKSAVDGMTSVINAYGLTADSAAKVSDTFFAGIKLGKTSFVELNSSLAQFVPAASAMGVSFEQSVAAISRLTAMGTPTAQAATQMQAAFTLLQKGNRNLVKALASSGLSLADLRKELAAPVDTEKGYGGLVNVMKKINDATESAGMELAQVTGRVEASKFIEQLAGSTDKYTASLQVFQGVQSEITAGASSQAFEVASQNLEVQLAGLKNTLIAGFFKVFDAVKPLVVNIIQILTPALKGMGDGLAGIFGFLNEYKSVIALTATAVGLYVVSAKSAAIATALWGRETKLNMLITRTAAIAQTIWSNVVALATGKTTLAAIAQQVWNGAIMANPIGAIIVGVLAFAAALHFLSDALRDSATERKAENDAQQEMLDKQMEINKQKQEQAKAQRDAVDVNNELAGSYLSLLAKTNRTAEEEKLLKDKLLEINQAYPGVIDGTEDYQAALEKLQGATDKSKREIANLSLEMQDLQDKSNSVKMEGLSIESEVAAENITSILTDSIGNFGDDIQEFITGTSDAKQRAISSVKDFQNSIYAATSENDVAKSVVDAQVALYNDPRFAAIPRETKNKLVAEFKNFGDKRVELIKAANERVAKEGGKIEDYLPPAPVEEISVWDEILNKIWTLFTPFKKLIDLIFNFDQTVQEAKLALSELGDKVIGWASSFENLGKNIKKWVLDSLKSVGIEVKWVGDLIDGIISTGKAAIETVGNLLSSVLGGNEKKKEAPLSKTYIDDLNKATKANEELNKAENAPPPDAAEPEDTALSEEELKARAELAKKVQDYLKKQNKELLKIQKEGTLEEQAAFIELMKRSQAQIEKLPLPELDKMKMTVELQSEIDEASFEKEKKALIDSLDERVEKEKEGLENALKQEKLTAGQRAAIIQSHNRKVEALESLKISKLAELNSKHEAEKAKTADDNRKKLNDAEMKDTQNSLAAVTGMTEDAINSRLQLGRKALELEYSGAIEAAKEGNGLKAKEYQDYLKKVKDLELKNYSEILSTVSGMTAAEIEKRYELGMKALQLEYSATLENAQKGSGAMTREYQDYLKKVAELEKKLAEDKIKISTTGAKQKHELELLELEFKYQQELDILGENNDAKLEAEKEYQRERAKIIDAYLKENNTAYLASLEARDAIREVFSRKEENDRGESLKEEINDIRSQQVELEKQRIKGEISYEEYAKRLSELTAQRTEKETELEKAHYGIVEKLREATGIAIGKVNEKLKKQLDESLVGASASWETVQDAATNSLSIISLAAGQAIATSQDTGKAVLLAALDVLESLIPVFTAMIFGVSMASPENITTLGVWGAIKFAALTAGLYALVAVAKSQVAGAETGYLPGVKDYQSKPGATDTKNVWVDPLEAIIPRDITAREMPLLKALLGGKTSEEYFREIGFGFDRETVFKDILPGWAKEQIEFAREIGPKVVEIFRESGVTDRLRSVRETRDNVSGGVSETIKEVNNFFSGESFKESAITKTNNTLVSEFAKTQAAAAPLQERLSEISKYKAENQELFQTKYKYIQDFTEANPRGFEYNPIVSDASQWDGGRNNDKELLARIDNLTKTVERLEGTRNSRHAFEHEFGEAKLRGSDIEIAVNKSRKARLWRAG